ncbi:MAG: YidB family protein [Polaromonas sp.]|nr:YidB family protein [Polaromonas sp.]
MANSLIEEILAGVLSNASRGRGQPGAEGTSLDGGAGGGLGDLLGGMLGRGGAPADSAPERNSPFGGGGGGGALLAVLLPLAMQWVQRNGGLGAVLGKFQQKGYSQQAASWVSTGENEAMPRQAIDEVVGLDELSRLSQQLGVPQQEVADGFAQILPEVVNQLTPQGGLSGDADDVLAEGMAEMQAMLARLNPR